MSRAINQDLIDRVVQTFRSQFSADPEILLHAPGRINLIGEHTDYNMGYVLPAAVPYGVYFAIGRSAHAHEWIAIDKDERKQISPDQLATKHGGWVDYLLGAWLETRKEHPDLPMLHCAFAADLPEGAGLSSSSALTCGMLLGVSALAGIATTPAQIAWTAHLVERNYVGLQGGIMDQHACMLSKAGHLLLLDCRDRSFEHIPFSGSDVHVFLINTNVKHNLTETDYNIRADECAQAVNILNQEYQIESLRDAQSDHLEGMKRQLGPVLLRRAHFVIQENNRVLETVSSIQDQDWQSVGQYMYASHAGLRSEYEVSCAELDFLVEIAQREHWVYGARMMGGGFGGCIIVLSQHPPDPAFVQKTEEQYFLAFGQHPSFIDVTLSGAAAIFSS